MANVGLERRALLDVAGVGIRFGGVRALDGVSCRVAEGELCGLIGPNVAGKTTLEHLLDMFKTLPDPANVKYVFILGPYLGEQQVPKFMQENYPDLKVEYVVQHEMKGQSHALWLAREHLRGPMMVVFSDSIIETDFSFLDQEQADCVAWVLPFPDPRRFGVAEVGPDGWVRRFIEKPPGRTWRPR